MEEIRYVDRRNTNCNKWDGQTGMFGEEGLHAMWVADMDFQVPQCVMKALHDYVSLGVYGYYKIPDGYYQSFMDWEETMHGCKVERDWLRFSPGVVAGFHWLIQIFTEPEDAVIVQTPVYYPFLNAVKNNNRRLICSDLRNDHGKYDIDFEDFEKKIVENKVRLFLLCSPHNPVGRVWKKEELEKLLEICRRHQVVVISDEIHQDLVFENHRHIPTLNLREEGDRIVTLTAPSKTFNLAGGQNSIVILPDAGLQKEWDTYTTANRVISGNAFGYVAAQAAYEGGASWLEAVRKQIWENYQYLKAELSEKLPQAVVSPMEGTYLCWVDLGAYLSAGQVKETIQKKCRLAVDFGDWFGGERFGTCIRINLATSLENVRTGVEALVAHLA